MLGLLIPLIVIWTRNVRGEIRAGRDAAGTDGTAELGFSRPFILPVLAFGIIYALTLFGSASIAYINKLGGRFLLPLYLPFITLLMAAVATVLKTASRTASGALRLAGPIVASAALIATAVLLLQTTIPLVSASHTDGATGGDNVFNTKAWNKNQAIEYWRQNSPQGPYRLFSNQPDAVTFFSGHATLGSPRSTSGPYSTDFYSLSSYAPGLFATSQPVYLVWIEPSPAAYFYTVEEIATIANVEPLFVSADGGVYRLTPIPGS